jgi:hypothetical protein
MPVTTIGQMARSESSTAVLQQLVMHQRFERSGRSEGDGCLGRGLCSPCIRNSSAAKGSTTPVNTAVGKRASSVPMGQSLLCMWSTAAAARRGTATTAARRGTATTAATAQEPQKQQ